MSTTGPDWVRDAVFYQIFPDRFCKGEPTNDPPGVREWGKRPTRRSFFGGDLAGVRSRLDYLQDLGITALYLTPIFRSPSNHKYDTVDYDQVDPHLGGNDALHGLLADAHARGMRVILDGVFGHSSDQHPFFRDLAARGNRSPYRHWYRVRRLPIRKRPPSYQACGGVPWLPRWNHDHPPVREYLYAVARRWLAAGVDGWRLDVPWEVPHDFWRGFRAAVRSVRDDAYLLGEAWGDAAPWLQGDQWDGATDYRLRELLLRFCVQQAIDGATFGRELLQLRASVPAGSRAWMATLLGSHDTPRIMTLARGRRDAVACLFAFALTYEGVPLLYYGDEVGLHGGPDPDNRRCMPWTEDAWDVELLALVRRLVKLRHQHPSLRRGAFMPVGAQERAYAYERSLADDRILVVLNCGFQPERLTLRPSPPPPPVWVDVLRGSAHDIGDDGSLSLTLPASGFAILRPAR